MERMSSWGSSVSRHSLTTGPVLDNDAESECVSESGDIGDRALHSQRRSESGSLHFSFDLSPENRKVQAYPAAASNPISCMKSSPHIMTTLSTNGKVGSEDIKQEPVKELPQILNYVSCLVHLAVSGILGVLTRYLLQKLFGPKVAGVTSDQTILYLDLPSNVVGSFLMGWFGVVFKADISHVSEHLAIALTTGYLGSLTTFSGWNQKMLELSVAGHWLFSVLGFLIGLFLVAFSFIFGIETAKGVRWLLRRPKTKTSAGSSQCGSKVNWKVDSYNRQLVVMIVLSVMLGLFWGVSGAIVKAKFKHGGSAAQLWLACIVGPLGVWIRWFLARLNGRGIGREEFLKWIPFGTLIANVSAACVTATLATVMKSVNTTNCDTIIIGIQFGVLGCLSTVSTFVAEFNAMRESQHPWRAYAYAMITITPSFCFGILIYCIPVWRT